MGHKMSQSNLTPAVTNCTTGQVSLTLSLSVLICQINVMSLQHLPHSAAMWIKQLQGYWLEKQITLVIMHPGARPPGFDGQPHYFLDVS